MLIPLAYRLAHAERGLHSILVEVEVLALELCPAEVQVIDSRTNVGALWVVSSSVNCG